MQPKLHLPHVRSGGDLPRAGLDLHGYGDAPGANGTDETRDRLVSQTHMSRLILRLRATPQPVIAAVNGPAAGFGLALALGSDIRYAAKSAVFLAWVMPPPCTIVVRM